MVSGTALLVAAGHEFVPDNFSANSFEGLLEQGL